MHRTKNDIKESTRTAIVALLDARLADCLDLKSQAKQAHWNVKGPSFIALHELFDKVAEAADEAADLTAERIAQLGGTAHGTVRVAAARSTLPEYPLEIADGMEHVAALSTALAAAAKTIRQDIDRAAELDDADTADILTEVSRSLDKYLWFVEAHGQSGR